MTFSTAYENVYCAFYILCKQHICFKLKTKAKSKFKKSFGEGGAGGGAMGVPPGEFRGVCAVSPPPFISDVQNIKVFRNCKVPLIKSKKPSSNSILQLMIYDN